MQMNEGAYLSLSMWSVDKEQWTKTEKVKLLINYAGK